MNKEDFDNYLKTRYYKQIEWYDKKAISSNHNYKIFQWVLIILSALTPVFIIIDTGNDEYQFFRWIAVIIAMIVAIATSALRTFKFYDNWLEYRTTCESLRKEKFLFDANANEYSITDNKESLFVRNVESMISKENSMWFAKFKKKDDNNQSTET